MPLHVPIVDMFSYTSMHVLPYDGPDQTQRPIKLDSGMKQLAWADNRECPKHGIPTVASMAVGASGDASFQQPLRTTQL